MTKSEIEHQNRNMKTNQQLRMGLLAGLVLAAIVGCSKPEAKMTTLEGRWIGFQGGHPDATCTLVISGTQLDYRGAQSNDWCRGSFVLNEEAQPMQLDLTMQAISDPDYVGKTALGIYELKGGELRVAVAEPGSGQRPANLAGEQGVRVFSFKRE